MINLTSRTVLGINQQNYQNLRLALSLPLRRQVLVAVCDDLGLQARLMTQLEKDATRAATRPPQPQTQGQATPDSHGSIGLIRVQLNLENPDLLSQVAQTVKHYKQDANPKHPMPHVQILGIGHLTRQPAAVQHSFLESLRHIEALLPHLESSLLIWMPWPWLRTVQQSVPEFWRCRSGVFEFVGEPTPMGDAETDETALAQLDYPFAKVPTLPHPPQLQLRAQARSSLETQATTQATHATTPIAVAIATPATAEAASVAVTQPPEILLQDGHKLLESPVLDTSTTDMDAADMDTVDMDTADIDTANNLDALAADTPMADASTLEMDAVGVNPDLWQILTEDLAKLDTESGMESSLAPSLSQSGVRSAISTQRQPIVDALPRSQVTHIPSYEAPSRVVATHVVVDDPDAVDQESPATQPLNTAACLTPVVPLPNPMVPRFLAQRQRIERLEQQQADPAMLAAAYVSLGRSYRDLVETGDLSPETMMAAIQAYEAATQWLPETSPNWSHTLNDLGSLYWITAQQAEDVDQKQMLMHRSIQTYKTAVSKLDATPEIETALRLHSNLGAAYSLLAQWTNPVEHLEQAIRSYHRALHYRSGDAYSLDYAAIQNSLGAAYWKLAQYGRTQQRLHAAIAAYTESLHHRQPYKEPLDYGMVLNNLGIAYWSLSRHERPEFLLKRAVATYRNALAYRTLDADPWGCAATQNNLGTAYWDLARHYTQTPAKQLKLWHRTQVAYEAALEAVQRIPPGTAMGLSFDPAATHHSLGIVYEQIAKHPLLHPDRMGNNLQQSLSHYLAAFHGWQEHRDNAQTALQSLVHSLKTHYDLLGLEGQQRALAQIPAELIAVTLPQL